MKVLDVFPENVEDMKLNRIHGERVMKILEPLDMNILLYGCKDSGKKTIIQCVMNSMFPFSKISECNMVSTNDDEKLVYKLNNYYIEINCNSVRSKNKQTIINLIKNFCSSLSFGDDGKLHKRIIIIHDLDILHRQIQFSMRRLMEIYDTCVFVFTTCKMNNFIDSMQSRCLCYRLPYEKDDVCELFKKMKIQKAPEDGVLKSLLKVDNANFINLNYKIITDFITKKPNNINQLRNALYDILSCNIECTEVMKTILVNLNLGKYSNDKQIKITILAADTDLMNLSGSKDIINLEYFVIGCKVLLSNKE